MSDRTRDVFAKLVPGGTLTPEQSDRFVDAVLRAHDIDRWRAELVALLDRKLPPDVAAAVRLGVHVEIEVRLLWGRPSDPSPTVRHGELTARVGGRTFGLGLFSGGELEHHEAAAMSLWGISEREADE